MNFQVLNVANPNAPQNSCVFAMFEAGDTVVNLHVALDRYKDEIESLHGRKWK